MCIIRPQKAEALCQQLLASQLVHDLRAVEIRGRGRRGEAETQQGPLEYLPKVAVTMYGELETKDQVVEMVHSSCRSGRRGDGKIFITDVIQTIEF